MTFNDKNKKNIISFKALENREEAVINGNLNNNIVLDVYDPEIDDLLKIIPLKVPGARVEKIYESIGFNIIPSFQEVVIAINNDDTEFVKNKDSLQITSKHVAFSITHQPLKNSKTDELIK